MESIGCRIALAVCANGCAQAPKGLHFRAQHRVLLEARLYVELPRHLQCLIHEGTQELQREPGIHQTFLRALVDRVVCGRPNGEDRYS